MDRCPGQKIESVLWTQLCKRYGQTKQQWPDTKQRSRCASRMRRKSADKLMTMHVSTVATEWLCKNFNQWQTLDSKTKEQFV